MYTSATSSAQFYLTRNIFRDSLKIKRPMSYNRWVRIPDDMKAAALYVNFFEQITLAWYKTASVYSSDADGVSTVLQYLQKNVAKILDDSKRYTPAYIYRVAYNCLFCLCRDNNRHRRVYDNETSNIQNGPDGEFNLFDTVTVEDNRDSEDRSEMIQTHVYGMLTKDGRDLREIQFVASDIVGCDYNVFSEPDCKHADEDDTVIKHHVNKLDSWGFKNLVKQYNDGIVTSYDVIDITATDKGTFYRVSFDRIEDRPRKGFDHKRCKISESDKANITDARRKEIIDTLRELLSDLEYLVNE